jgi:hypothetical protein
MQFTVKELQQDKSLRYEFTLNFGTYAPNSVFRKLPSEFNLHLVLFPETLEMSNLATMELDCGRRILIRFPICWEMPA